MLQDNDPMPFGKYKGKAMIEVPKSWLLWFYDEVNRKGRLGSPSLGLVYNYIVERKEAIEKEKEVFETTKRRSGFLVKTKTGKKGIVYHDEERVGGKNKTYIVDENMKPTGLRMLCDPMEQKIIGFID